MTTSDKSHPVFNVFYKDTRLGALRIPKQYDPRSAACDYFEEDGITIIPLTPERATEIGKTEVIPLYVPVRKQID